MSPITRETLAARIATLEADSNISIKEGFYLQTMRLLLAEMDKPAPHHNGMMQLSNELADLKRNYAELQDVVGQRNGECDCLIKEQQDLVMLVKVLVRTVKKYNHGSDLAKRATDYLTKNGLISAADFLRGGVLSAHEQVDTSPAQFESLAGEPVTKPYKLPFDQWLSQQNEPIDVDCGCVNTEAFYHWLRVAYEAGNSPVIPVGSDVEHVAAVLELIGSFDAADIEGDTVDLRFEVDGVDTGADASITEYAARGASIIRQLAGAQEVKS